MLGIIPNNTGGFGDDEKISHVFVRNELMPPIKRFEELNDCLVMSLLGLRPTTAI